MRRILAIVAIAFLVGCASTQAPEVWNAEKISRMPYAATQLQRTDTKRIVGVVSVPRVRLMSGVATRLETAANVKATLELVEGADPNAYSYPGTDGRNYVCVNLGMFQLVGNDPDAWAALLGHELAHLALGHNAKRQERENVRTASSLAAGLALTLAGVPMGANLADVATQAAAASYSRDEERDADAKGLEYAEKAGFDPAGAVRLWEKLAAKSPGGGPLQFLNDHPASEERLETMRAAAAR